MGYENKVYPDLILETQRTTGSTYAPKKYYYYGLGLKALGYTTPYALVRILLFSRKKPKGAYFMLKGFFSKYDDLYEDTLRNYVRTTQRKNILHLNPKYIKRIFKG